MLRYFKAAWLIPLFSTMFGVVAGFYFTDYNETKKLLNKRNKAFEQVQKEIEENFEIIQTYRDTTQVLTEALDYFFENSKLKEESIWVEKDIIDSFLLKTAPVFQLDSMQLIGYQYKMSGDLSVNFGVNNISTINWQTYKQMNFNHLDNFDCITDMEQFYDLLEDFKKHVQNYYRLLTETVPKNYEDYMRILQEISNNSHIIMNKADLILQVEEAWKKELLPTCEL